ncbi:MAG: acyltransferase family protein [Halobacteriota archaeon]
MNDGISWKHVKCASQAFFPWRWRASNKAKPKTFLERLPELDIARALAICIIVLVHSYYFLATDPNPVLRPYLVSTAVLDFLRNYIASGALALFFFVSGFALYRNNRVFATWRDATHFLSKRAVRIFPLYWVAVTVCVIMFGLLPLAPLAMSYNASDIVTWFSAYGTMTTIIYVAGLQGLISTPPYVTNQMPALWFVGVILVYYLIYPLIMAFSAKTTGSPQMPLSGPDIG